MSLAARRPVSRAERFWLAALWALGTLGRSLVFGAWLIAVVAYDDWEARTHPDGGASFIFVLVWPAEVGIAAVWSAVDVWRRLPWLWLVIRWTVVGLTAALGLVVEELRTLGADPDLWSDLPAWIGSQLIVVIGGAAAGAAISYAFTPSRPSSGHTSRP